MKLRKISIILFCFTLLTGCSQQTNDVAIIPDEAIEISQDKEIVEDIENTDDEIIDVNFRTPDQLINYPIDWKSSEIFQ